MLLLAEAPCQLSHAYSTVFNHHNSPIELVLLPLLAGQESETQRGHLAAR